MLSERLKELRKGKGLSQVEFAKLFNISTGTIGNWEIGARQPDYETLVKIADYFNVSIDFLLGRNNNIDILQNFSKKIDEPTYVPPPVLDGVYYRLAQEAQEKGILPEDVEKIIEIFNKYKS